MQEPWDDLHDLQYDLRRLVWYTPANPELRNRMPNMDAEPVANHRRPTISVLDGFDRTSGAKSKCDIHTQVPPRVPPRVASFIPPSRRDPHVAVAWWDGAVSVIDVAWAHGMCGFEPRRFHISLLSPLAPLVVPHSLPSCGSTGCALSSVHPRVLHQVLSTHCALHSVQCALPSVLCPLCPALCPV